LRIAQKDSLGCAATLPDRPQSSAELVGVDAAFPLIEQHIAMASMKRCAWVARPTELVFQCAARQFKMSRLNFMPRSEVGIIH
jgi:hypothetical protein